MILPSNRPAFFPKPEPRKFALEPGGGALGRKASGAAGVDSANQGGYGGSLILVSMDWFKGTSTGNHGFYHQR